MTLSARRAGAAALALAAACAAPKQAWKETSPPQVLVEVLPRNAELTVDGVSAGPGSHTVAVPEPERVYRFRVAAPGFSPAERSAKGAQLAGARVGVALRPEGYGEARPLDFDQGPGLATAAAFLERGGKHELALDYAERAAELAPELPLPRRVLGDASLALGRRTRAVQEYSTYLRLAPTAPDRAAVERRVEGLRGDLTIPAPAR